MECEAVMQTDRSRDAVCEPCMYTLSVSVRTGLEGLGVPALEEAIERAAAPPAAPAPPLPIIFRALRSLFLRFSRGTGSRGRVRRERNKEDGKEKEGRQRKGQVVGRVRKRRREI